MAGSVAVMQPYVFPYVGYFSLVQACDRFVFFDDVNHRPRGWVHRNRILLGGRDHLFTVPLAGASQNGWIVDTRLHDLAAFRRSFISLLQQAYRRAPHHDAGMDYVEQVLAADCTTIAELGQRSVELACRRIGLERPFLCASQAFAVSRGIGRSERLMAITRALGATRYVNSIGGRALYEPGDFEAHGLELAFVEPQLRPYAQVGAQAFVPGLSIIDLFMHLDATEVRRHVAAFSCLAAASGPRPQAGRAEHDEVTAGRVDRPDEALV